MTFDTSPFSASARYSAARPRRRRARYRLGIERQHAIRCDARAQVDGGRGRQGIQPPHLLRAIRPAMIASRCRRRKTAACRPSAADWPAPASPGAARKRPARTDPPSRCCPSSRHAGPAEPLRPPDPAPAAIGSAAGPPADNWSSPLRCRARPARPSSARCARRRRAKAASGSAAENAATAMTQSGEIRSIFIEYGAYLPPQISCTRASLPQPLR